MKQGVRVKVVACTTGHEFSIDEVVTRVYSDHDEEYLLGFRSEYSGVWYMKPHEYEVINEYDTAVITNVHKGKASQGRQHITYAELRTKSGELLISATLDYVVDALLERKTNETP